VRGYDEGYFMYLEDADICHRLWLSGGKVVVCTSTEVVHDARRATLKSARHMRWHAASLLRYLRLSATRPAVRRPPAAS
jgi:GT2 family glycosyltransferase